MNFDYIDENIIKQYPASIEYDGDDGNKIHECISKMCTDLTSEEIQFIDERTFSNNHVGKGLYDPFVKKNIYMPAAHNDATPLAYCIWEEIVMPLLQLKNYDKMAKYLLLAVELEKHTEKKCSYIYFVFEYFMRQKKEDINNYFRWSLIYLDACSKYSNKMFPSEMKKYVTVFNDLLKCGRNNDAWLIVNYFCNTTISDPVTNGEWKKRRENVLKLGGYTKN